MLRAANRRGERRPPLSVTKHVAIAPDSCRLEETATLRGVSAPVRFLRVAVGDVTDRVRPVHRVTKDARLSAGHRARLWAANGCSIANRAAICAFRPAGIDVHRTFVAELIGLI